MTVWRVEIDNPQHALWACKRMDMRLDLHGAQIIALLRNGAVQVVVVFNRFTSRECEIHVASLKSAWWPPGFLYYVYAYPFIQLKLARITAHVRQDNSASKALTLAAGFEIEGIKRDDAPYGQYVLGLLKRECRFISERYRRLSLALPASVHKPKD